MGTSVGFSVLCLQPAARRFLRRRARQRGSRSSIRLLRLFLRTPVDQLRPRRRNRHSRLVHYFGRCPRPDGTYDARRAVGSPQDHRCAQSPAESGGSWLPLTALVTAVTFKIQPQVRENLATYPWGLVFPFLAIAGLAGIQFEVIKRD